MYVVVLNVLKWIMYFPVIYLSHVRCPKAPSWSPSCLYYISMTAISDCSISLYADDTALYYASSSHVDLMLNLRHDIDSISQWLNLNTLTLNTKKTKCMIFGTRNVNDIPIFINGDVIERVTELKYLGVYLDQYLPFDRYIKYVYSKASSKLGKSENVLIILLLAFTRDWSCYTMIIVIQSIWLLVRNH